MSLKNKVNISGQEYAFKTGADPKFIQSVADYINKKIESAPRELRDTCHTCLKEIITESLKKGINIKFEKQ